MNDKDIFFFQRKLIKWFTNNGRSFQWREPSATKYEIIISEILLQRTTAKTIKRYLPFFLSKYPSWKELAATTEKEIQNTLMPIGLYRQKGTGLHKLSKMLLKNNFLLPSNRTDARKLPLFGEYITNAYDLLILKNNAPLLDENMKRLLIRFFGKNETSTNTQLKEIAYKVVDIKESVKINWAILDYAALVCKIQNPLCHDCTLKNKCAYYNTTPN